VKTFNDFINSDFGQKIVAIWDSIVTQVTSTYETWKQIWNHPVVQNWVNKFKEGMDTVGKALEIAGKVFGILWDIAKVLWPFWLGIGGAIAFVFNAAIDAYDNSKGKFEALKKFFETIWESVKPEWDAFIKKIQELDVAKKIMESWQKLKTFFTKIWDDVAPKWDKFLSPISKLWGNIKTKVPLVGKLLAPDNAQASITSKLPPLNGVKPAPVTKNQNVTNNITVNASKISDPKEVAKQVSKEMEGLNWNYLFDPIGAVP
jgi:hypothetical protein